MGFLADTDHQIQQASVDPVELERLKLRGKPAQEVWDSPVFFGSPEEAEELAAMPAASAFNSEQLIRLAVQLKQPAEGTVKGYRQSLAHLVEFLGKDFPLTITKEQIREFRDQLLTRYKVSSAKKTIRILSSLHELALEEGHATENPYKGVLKNVRNERKEEKEEIPQEAWETVEVLPEVNQRLFWLIAYSGMRVTEALGLRTKDIDLKAKTITITAHKLRPLKNDASDRTIPIDERLMPYLKGLDQTSEELVFPMHRSAAGNWTTPSFWQRRLGFGPHLLRHHLTTNLRAAGVGESVLAGLLGHTPPSMTARYGAVPVQTMRKALEKVSWER